MPFRWPLIEAMRNWEGDSRLILLVLTAEGVEATGLALWRFLERVSKRGRLIRMMRDLESSGLIGGSGEGPLDGRLFRITELGRAVARGDFDPEALWGRTWDGTWRLAMFDVPQSQASLRTRLRRKLRELRFGWLQNSVWLSPDPVSQLVRQLAQREVSVESLLFIEGRPAGGETDAELVAGGWDFAGLAKLHAQHLKLLRTRPTSGRQTKAAEWAAWIGAERQAWRELERRDPFLPATLLPLDYAGRAVWQARVEALRAVGQSMSEGVGSA